MSAQIELQYDPERNVYVPVQGSQALYDPDPDPAFRRRRRSARARGRLRRRSRRGMNLGRHGVRLYDPMPRRRRNFRRGGRSVVKKLGKVVPTFAGVASFLVGTLRGIAPTAIDTPGEFVNALWDRIKEGWTRGLPSMDSFMTNVSENQAVKLGAVGVAVTFIARLLGVRVPYGGIITKSGWNAIGGGVLAGFFGPARHSNGGRTQSHSLASAPRLGNQMR